MQIIRLNHPPNTILFLKYVFFSLGRCHLMMEADFEKVPFGGFEFMIYLVWKLKVRGDDLPKTFQYAIAWAQRRRAQRFSLQ